MSNTCYVCGSSEGYYSLDAPPPQGLYWLCKDCMFELVDVMKENRDKNQIKCCNSDGSFDFVFPNELPNHVGKLIKEGKHLVITADREGT